MAIHPPGTGGPLPAGHFRAEYDVLRNTVKRGLVLSAAVIVLSAAVIVLGLPKG